MQSTKGIVTGFVAGLVVAGGAVLLMRDEAAPRAEESAQVADLSAKIDRLERSISQQSLQARAPSPAVAGSGGTTNAEVVPEADAKEEKARVEEQQRVIASADARVEEAIQTGQWSSAKARELDQLTANLPAEERRRIHTRIAAAINSDQIKMQLP